MAALCALIAPIAPARAAAPESASLSAAASPTAPVQASAGVGNPADTLYDLGPLEQSHPELTALVGAARSGRDAAVIALAPAAIRKASSDEVRTAALYMLATAQQHSRKKAAAARTWKRLAQSGPLADHARLQLADLALERGDRTDALAALAALSPDHPARMESRLRMAEIELDRGQVGAASAIIERIDGRDLTDEQRDQLRLLQGDVARRQGDADRAVEHYRSVWRTGSGSRAEAGLERLAALGYPPDPVDRMARMIGHVPRSWPRGRRGRVARREVRARIDKLGSGTPGLAGYGHGLLLARSRAQREQAVDALQKALGAAQAPELVARIRYELGDLLGKLNRDKEAIAVLEPVLEDAPDKVIEARVLWRLVRLYTAENRTLDVDRVLARLLEEENDTSKRDEARWSLAWRRYRVGDCPEALRLLDGLDRPGATFNHGRQSWRARSRYWQARCQARAGQEDKAIALWLSVIAAHPLTWYGALSLDRIRELRPELAERLQGQPPPEGPADEMQLETLRVRREATLDGPVLLIRVGDLREASTMLRARLRAGLSNDGVHLLAAVYRTRGLDRMAFAVLQRYTRTAARPDPGTVGVWRQAFPTPFRPLFEKAAQEAGIPRAWLYAIASHESSFVPTARSNAGAVGLVQLLPKVAARIAELYGLKVRHRSALVRPAYNLDLGARYLSELKRMYRDNLPLAAAGYNAGPYAVRGWLKGTGVLPTDVFVESIPYQQARRYAQRVTATAQSYAWLYPEWQEVDLITSGRPALVPSRLGPFMQGPDGGTTSLRWPQPPLARPDPLRAAQVDLPGSPGAFGGHWGVRYTAID